MTNTIDISVIEDIRKKGFRITQVRKLIVRILQEVKKPLTVQEIILELHRKDLSPNKTTIYRELEFLMSLSLLKEIGFGDGKKRYELDTGTHHHHIVCVNCGRVDDIELKADLSLDEIRIQKQTGFKIIEHAIELFGLCKKCQR